MKAQKFIFALLVACFTLVGCQKEIKKENRFTRYFWHDV